jgi:Uma2 family endonuclease
LNEKFRLYERHGVREYWVVDPWARTVCVYRPAAKGRFDRGELHEASISATKIESRVLEGLAIDVRALFSGLE